MAIPPTQEQCNPDPNTPPSVSDGMMWVSILTVLPLLLREMGQEPDRLLDELKATQKP